MAFKNVLKISLIIFLFLGSTSCSNASEQDWCPSSLEEKADAREVLESLDYPVGENRAEKVVETFIEGIEEGDQDMVREYYKSGIVEYDSFFDLFFEKAKKLDTETTVDHLSKSIDCSNEDILRTVSLRNIFERNDHKEIIKSLVKNGVDINTRASGDWTLLQMAENLDLIQFLVKNDAKVDRKGFLKKTPLIWAAQKGNLKVVQYLHQKGASISSRDENGLMPIHGAALAGDTEVVQFLLSNGADLNAKTDDKKTSLHYAASKGHRSMVEYLVNRGADTDLKSDEGETPLDLASTSDIQEYLKRVGDD